MNNMAVASRSPADARDARVPCAQCGGLVHPIAGRCKHCKADLAAARTAHAPALAVLPPLANPTSAPAPAKPLPQIAAPAPLAVPPNAETLVGATPVVMASAVPSIVVATAPAREAYNPMPDGRPILPPRPTGRMRARGDERGWLARNWPVIVIVLASIAIILAVILMDVRGFADTDFAQFHPGGRQMLRCSRDLWRMLKSRWPGFSPGRP